MIEEYGDWKFEWWNHEKTMVKATHPGVRAEGWMLSTLEAESLAFDHAERPDEKLRALLAFKWFLRKKAIKLVSNTKT